MTGCGGALNRGEPLFVQNHSRLASTFDEVARELGGLPVKAREAARAGLFAMLGGRR